MFYFFYVKKQNITLNYGVVKNIKTWDKRNNFVLKVTWKSGYNFEFKWNEENVLYWFNIWRIFILFSYLWPYFRIIKVEKSIIFKNNFIHTYELLLPITRLMYYLTKIWQFHLLFFRWYFHSLSSVVPNKLIHAEFGLESIAKATIYRCVRV